VAALRAAQLGARTTLVARDSFGGMAANDGQVPVRTLAHAARLTREARQLAGYGIEVSEPGLDYRRLLGRVAEVVEQVRTHSALRRNLEAAGVIHPRARRQSAVRGRSSRIEEQWRIMQPLLDAPPPTHPYAPGSWGPPDADALVADHRRWYGPWVA
jgi:pyruvate/2-oxoglutarate dehydrogenase complex dihydrolipoamide dehydrogenase (E3) component